MVSMDSILVHNTKVRYQPSQPARVSNAHSVNTINSKTYYGDGNSQSIKTVAKGHVDMNADLKAIDAGKGFLIDKEKRLVQAPSGNVYSYHQSNSAKAVSYYPVKANNPSDFVQLTRAEFRIYKNMVRDGGLKGGSLKAFEGMMKSGNAGLSSDSKNKLIDLFNSRK